ncbi:MAG: DNA cytosine methyltransferase [Archangium sp.]|nr:DNA cytosine methyltransferase [Archangium sp.]
MRRHTTAQVAAPFLPASEVRPSTYSRDGERFVRLVQRRDGSTASSVVRCAAGIGADLPAESGFDQSWLRTKSRPPLLAGLPPIRIVDMFSGCGGLSLGITEAARALGRPAEHVIAVDLFPEALQVFALNFPEVRPVGERIEHVVDGSYDDALTSQERKLRREAGDIDILVAGPPCQGHSDLNNHTRRNDPRNSLYFHMVRCAEVLRPRHVIIENVPGVIHDRSGVVERTTAALADLGYFVDGHVFQAATLGVPQRRRRHLLVASKEHRLSLASVAGSYSADPRSMEWACGDLVGQEKTVCFDSASTPSERNQERIDYLFDHDLYELPDAQRPDCHRLKEHSYKSVYGRLRWTDPVPTITSGFGSMGQGRFVHAGQRRTLTPHEAARLQFFPDFFRFDGVARGALQTMIGNAVPSKLSYVVALELLR